MRTEVAFAGGLKGFALAGAVALSLVAGGAFAQPPGSPPQGPSGAQPPSGPPGGPPGPTGGNAANPFAPPEPQLTEAQKLAQSLPAPQPGGMLPVPANDADAPMPAADPRDLQGTWIHNQNLEFRMQRDMYGNLVPYTMAGAKVLERRVMSLKNGAPFINASAKCRPPGPQWQRDLNMPFQIFQSKDWLEVVFEEYHGRWHILLNPDAAPAPAQKDYMGRSVGHWDGDTLVVETSDFREATWLDVDGTPLSAKGKLIQRIRKVDTGDREPFLEIITTIEDPLYYTKPWSVVRTFGWHPAFAKFKEYNCEEQIGDPSISANAGLVPEPTD